MREDEIRQTFVPAGWKLVPLEPTPEMRKAAADAWFDCGSRLFLNKAAEAVKAGIAAAPNAPYPVSADPDRFPYTPAQLAHDHAFRVSTDPGVKNRPRLRHPGEGVRDYRVAMGWDIPIRTGDTNA